MFSCWTPHPAGRPTKSTPGLIDNAGTPARANVARRPTDVCDVEIQHRGGLAERDERPLHVRFASEQAALFGGGRDEQDASRGPRQLRERLRGTQDRSDARRVVLRAVVDGVHADGWNDALVI